MLMIHSYFYDYSMIVWQNRSQRSESNQKNKNYMHYFKSMGEIVKKQIFFSMENYYITAV